MGPALDRVREPRTRLAWASGACRVRLGGGLRAYHSFEGCAGARVPHWTSSLAPMVISRSRLRGICRTNLRRFETNFTPRVTPAALGSPCVDRSYYQCWTGLKSHFTGPPAPPAVSGLPAAPGKAGAGKEPPAVVDAHIAEQSDE